MTRHEENLVTVIIPAYNAEHTIEQAVRSVLSQTHAYLQLLVVDDCSTDGTVAKVQGINDARVSVLLSARNAGVAEARNRGLEAAASRYVAFCDADDFWETEKLELQLRAMQAQHCPVVATHVREFSTKNPDGRIREAPKQIRFETLQRRNVIFFSSALVDFDKLTFKTFRQIFHEDYDFWLRNSKALEGNSNQPFAYCIQLPLCWYRVHQNNITRNKLKSLRKHFSVQRLNGLSRRKILALFFANLIDRAWYRFRRMRRALRQTS